MIANDQANDPSLFEITENRKRVVLFTILCFLVML